MKCARFSPSHKLIWRCQFFPATPICIPVLGCGIRLRVAAEHVLSHMNVSNVTLHPPVPTASVRPSERFSIGIVGPYGSFAVAPQRAHAGTGGVVPPHSSGACTGPLHLLQVPIVGIFISPGTAAQQFIQADAG